MEASQSVKADINESVNSERSRRPPRRAAVIARENVNLLRGKEPTAAELRENSSFEKPPDTSREQKVRLYLAYFISCFQNSLRDQIIAINSSDDEETDPKPVERKKSPTPPPPKSKSKRKLFVYPPCNNLCSSSTKEGSQPGECNSKASSAEASTRSSSKPEQAQDSESEPDNFQTA